MDKIAKHRASNKTLIIAKLIGTGKSVLDCGCGDGEIARALKQSGNQVVGVEVDLNKAQVAKQSCDQVIIGDLETETEEILAQLNGFCFDYILFSDVLEHLINPLSTLRRYVVLLKKPEGQVIISLPNVAYWRVRLNLLFGRWKYRNEGVCDRTHLHFYT